MFPSTILQAPSSSSLQNTLLRRYTNLSGPCATLCSNKPRGVLPCSLAPHWVQVVTPRSNQEPTLPSRSTPFLSSLSHTTRPISSATRVGTIVSMPLGWYLAQGLIPLGPSSSDDEEGPCELPNGRLVCGPHGLEVCGKCCVDYSFMDDVLGRDSENEDEDADSSKSDDMPSGVRPRKGTGRIFPTKFVPPSASVTPSELFTGQRQHMRITRNTLPNNTGKAIIRTDGACLDNGQQNPKAGWAFWHGSGPSGELLVASGRLEKKGPFGEGALQTSNRAELRAVIAALRFRYWPGEGFHTLVIATDSEYVVEGATNWARAWIQNGWVKRDGSAVKNRDLWEALLGELEKYKEEGMAIQFWKIPREWNMVADAAAKQAAAAEDAPNRWMDVMGMKI